MTTRADQRVSGPARWLDRTAMIGAAVTAGVFFDFSFVVMPAVRELPAAQGIAAMQALNRTAVTPPLMLLMYGTSLLCVVLAVRAARTRDGTRIVAAAVFLLATAVVTGAANVPLSAAVDALDPASAGAAASWETLATRWVWWNHLRIVAAVGAAGCFAIALHRSARMT